MIHISHVSKWYKKKQVLFDFSMNIKTEENMIYGLIGPNGAGKTTFIKLVSGILYYSEGSITVDENQNYDEWCKNNVVLIAAGERGMRNKNTVYDNVMLFAAMKGVKEEHVKGLIKRYAEILNYTDFLTRRIETLSMGEKKKAMLLCGLCTDMKLIIMDEPSNGLDIDAQCELKQIIRKLAEEFNKTFIISSHDLGFVSEIVNSYVFIFDGKNVNIENKSMQNDEIQEKYYEIKKGLL